MYIKLFGNCAKIQILIQEVQIKVYEFVFNKYLVVINVVGIQRYL